MADIRFISSGFCLRGKILYKVEEKGFFSWKEIGSIWAINPDEAYRLAYKEFLFNVR